MELHNPYKYMAGQWVEVTKPVDENIAAWYGERTRTGDEMVGKRVQIISAGNQLAGYLCEKRRLGRTYLPSTVLQLPSKKSVVVEVPSE